MDAARINFEIGSELEIKINNKIKTIPFFKWYTQKQKITQNNLFNVYENGSYFYNRWGYWNVNFGNMIEYNICKENISILAGISFSHIYQYENKDGYHLNVPANLPNDTRFRYIGYPQSTELSAKKNYFNAVVGSRINSNIKKIGEFKIGILLFIPFGNMPEYNFKSEIVSNNVSYNTDTNTKSKQLNLEISILYKLFNF